ncbi:MAG TPA: TonB family protein [Polyangia bacterium]|nr:TonB family protein [Polyangia bacterium]
MASRDPLKVGGLVVTLALHGGAVGLILYSHMRPSEPVLMPREFMVAKIVRLGRKRPKNLLPTIPMPPPEPTAPKEAVKLTENEAAKPAPKTEKPPPETKPGDFKQALARARQLEKLQAQADQEGDPSGDPSGTSDTASAGDLYATAIFKVYFEQWKVPHLASAQGLSARARVFINAQGNVLRAQVVKPSGNGPYDDSVVEVLNRVKKLPPPPPGLAQRFERSGLSLEFVP